MLNDFRSCQVGLIQIALEDLIASETEFANCTAWQDYIAFWIQDERGCIVEWSANVVDEI
jgi:hypothetical protein